MTNMMLFGLIFGIMILAILAILVIRVKKNDRSRIKDSEAAIVSEAESEEDSECKEELLAQE